MYMQKILKYSKFPVNFIFLCYNIHVTKIGMFPTVEERRERMKKIFFISLIGCLALYVHYIRFVYPVRSNLNDRYGGMATLKRRV